MNKIVAFCSALIVLVFVITGGEPQREAAEDLSIPSGVGIDLKREGDNLIYKIAISSYTYEEKVIRSRVSTGEARTIGQARQNRQLKLSKKFLIGLEKVDIISEEHARNGIRNILDALFNNPAANDTAFVTVCSGEARDILEYQIQGYPSSADFIEGMIKSSKTYSFFTENYRIIDVFVRLDSEGRNFTLPYLILTEEGLKIDGLALFKEDKMIGHMGIQDAKILNMLSEDSGKGIIAIQKSAKEYIEFYGKSKRRVKCYEENGKYTFDINLKLKGEIVANELNEKVAEDEGEKRKIEKEMSEKVEANCNELIKKMKEFKVDLLELGRIAAAKYGRDTGVDWNETVSNSKINVKVDLKIGRQGRGDY